MKATLTFLLVLIGIGLLLVVTKPSDQTCIDEMRDQVNSQIANTHQNKILKAVEQVAVDMGGQYGLRIEDHVFYKDIYIKGGSQKLATGILGTVIKVN